MQGILLVDKPEGWTSFDVVNYVRKIVARIEGKKPRSIKVGHTGTLDPAATGLLVLSIGKKYTAQMPEHVKEDKTYEVELTLGKISTTGDKEGEIRVADSRKPSKLALDEVLQSFVGVIEQIPPAYSAIKVNGKRAYELARSGKKVELAPRKVHVHSISDTSYAYPIVRFTTRVSSGTYIRSLGEDIGEKLGTGAYMSNLRRTSVGDITINQACAVSELTEDVLAKTLVTTE